MSHPIRRGFKRVTGLFAFWRYSTFPYVLGGPVMSMDDRGRIQTVTYGGSVFTPIKIMPAEAGKKLLDKIETLRSEHRMAERAFHGEWGDKIIALLPEAEQDKEP